MATSVSGMALAVLGGTWPASRARIAVVNLKFENEQKTEVLWQLEELEVELLLLVEIDRDWNAALQSLHAMYPHRAGVLRGEGLGIQLWSRLYLIAPEVQHLVSPDRASVHATVRLQDGQEVRLVGVHPLPPGLPDDDDGGRHDSRVRDAELMLIAKRVAAQPIGEPKSLLKPSWPKSSLLKPSPANHHLPKHHLPKHHLPKHHLPKHHLPKHHLPKHHLPKHNRPIEPRPRICERQMRCRARDGGTPRKIPTGRSGSHWVKPVRASRGGMRWRS